MLNYLKNISPLEFGIIVVLLVVVFGAKAITRLGKTGGETLREMKNIKKNFTEAFDDDTNTKKGVDK